MDLQYINASQICSIECGFVCINSEYEYRESKPKKGIFSKAEREGFYNIYYYDAQHYENSYFDNSEEMFIRGKKIYYYPFLRLKMSNGDNHKKTFRSHSEMFEYLSKNLLNNPMISWVNTKRIPEKRNVLLEKYQGYSDELRIILKNSLSTKIDKD